MPPAAAITWPHFALTARAAAERAHGGGRRESALPVRHRAARRLAADLARAAARRRHNRTTPQPPRASCRRRARQRCTELRGSPTRPVSHALRFSPLRARTVRPAEAPQVLPYVLVLLQRRLRGSLISHFLVGNALPKISAPHRLLSDRLFAADAASRLECVLNHRLLRVLLCQWISYDRQQYGTWMYVISAFSWQSNRNLNKAPGTG